MALTITSPGVQINEIDLSLRANLPAGTNVVVPGFASQGPTSEPILITTVSELQNVYGTPTTAAERYFYYSCAEVLNSPGTLTTIRLPYGLSAGADFSNAYSGLFYPLYANVTNTLSSNNVILSSVSASGYTIGQPVHVTLSQTDHDNITQGNYTWVAPNPAGYTFTFTTATTAAPTEGTTDGTYYYSSVVTLTGSLSDTSEVTAVQQKADLPGFTTGNNVISAGFFILNDLQTVINENSEGFYVGIADNTDPQTNGYASVTSIVTFSGEDSYKILSTEQFTTSVQLTSNFADLGSYNFVVSEALQSVGFTSFYGSAYNDQISLGVFKIRRSTVDGTTLTISNTEKYVGSFDSTRQVNSPTGGALKSAFIEDVVNNSSNTIGIFVNPALSQQGKWAGSNNSRVNVNTSSDSKSLFPIGVYTETSSNTDATKAIGEVPAKLDKVLSLINSTENTTVDVVVEAGLGTIYATTQQANPNGNYDDTSYIENVSDLNDDWNAVADEFIDFAQNQRQDCVVILDPLRQIFITGKDSKVATQTGSTFTTSIYNPVRTLISPINSNYAAIYGNWVKVNDLFSGRNVWVPFSGYAGAAFARNDAVAQPWYAPAGLNRGIFTAIDIAFNPNQKQRDKFYEIAVNPVVNFSGNGFSIFGEKTLQGAPSAFDRINVRRLFLALERSVQKSLKYFIFEPNTNFTRTRLRNVITPIFEYAKNSNGLYDYLIICDERNNTPDIIDQNQLIVDIYLKPVRTAEFINVNFIATTTSQNFQELI
jgi:hypothetical protein